MVVEQAVVMRAVSAPVGRDFGVLDERLEAALAFEAPYLIERLVKDRVVDSAVLAEELFRELKKYLVLCAVTTDAAIGMHSAMVDAAWHAFILFTSEYTDYGHRYFGGYLPHAPVTESVGAEQRARFSESKFDDFRGRYEALFDEPLPDVWYDINSITPGRRVINTKLGRLTPTHDGSMVQLIDDSGAAILSINELAWPGLNFIAQTSDFYVRELPGELTDEEKVGLAGALLGAGVLRVAP